MGMLEVSRIFLQDVYKRQNWIHAVLHKIEGDVWNSKYWYARTAGKQYEVFPDPREELLTIQNSLNEYERI